MENPTTPSVPSSWRLTDRDPRNSFQVDVMLFGGMLEASTRYSVPGSSLDISFHGDFIVTILAERIRGFGAGRSPLSGLAAGDRSRVASARCPASESAPMQPCQGGRDERAGGRSRWFPRQPAGAAVGRIHRRPRR